MNTGTAEKSAKSLALFISDLHLAEACPETTSAFLDFMANEATKTERLYILGDLFEYWAGDDDIESAYNRRIINAIRQLSNAGVAVFWVPGNRDFLTGDRFAAESGAIFLSDLHGIDIGGQKIAVAHGDAQCLEDPDYVKFRMMVRNPQWQQQFLSMPLEKRKLTIESFRKDAKKENDVKSDSVWDVTESAIEDVFSQTGAAVFIHGHTHRPGTHEHGSRKRHVLSDWDLDSEKKRGGWLELKANGTFVQHAIGR
jgi:UDP-2,3-diacylglucosamine hydrolase